MFHNPYSPHSHQVPNPGSPYQGPIPGGMIPGKQIFISGFVRHQTNSFVINLNTSYGANALHINPRFNAGCIVRNTNRNGWGAEERGGPMIFQQGQPFEMVILVDPSYYKVAINGVEAFTYAHRVNFQEVVALEINGEIDVNKILFSESGGRGNETHNPGIPASIPLHNLRPNSLIQIKGTVPHHCRRFEIDLQSGPGVQPNDMALHFNPRFDDPNSPQPVVIRTNRQGGGWGAEERSGHFPFAKGAPFDMLIRLGNRKWKVAVNGQHFVEFDHRNPWQGVNTLGISGDVQIHSVNQF